MSASCSDDSEQISDFALDTQELNMEAVGGTKEIQVSVPGNWTATTSESWVQVSPTNGNGTKTCVVKVDSTWFANKEREATVRFTTRNTADERVLKITQKGFEKSLSLSKTEVSLESYAESDERHFDVEVTSNVAFEIEIPEEAASWLSYEKYKFELDYGARPRKATIRFKWEGNTEMNNREAKVQFRVKSEDEDLVKHDALMISQDRSPEITPDQKGDSLALVIIERKLNVRTKWDKGEALMNWAGVRLWEEKDGCPAEKVGRVRAVEFSQFYTKEGIPEEIKHLTCLETLSLFSNGNKHMLSETTGTAITELTELKNLRIYSFGLTILPAEFKNLKNLVTLDLSGNNFQEVPAVLTPENFPNLKHLSLAGNRRGYEIDLSGKTYYPKEKWGGLYNTGNTLMRLFAWDNLVSLHLSNNIIKGTIPATIYGKPKYTDADIEAKGDTLKTAATKLKTLQKILPNCKDLRIGLNYLSGTIPDWMLFHPYLMFWSPETSIFNQNRGLDDNGRMPGFTNVPKMFEYYYDLYPVFKPKF